ncbi:MAG: hypothetical protein ACREMU_05940 [Gemmatimonadaceae bacterium]
MIMTTVVTRVAKGAAILCLAAMAGGCHRHSANATSLAPEVATDDGGARTPALLTRGDKLMVMIDGEKRGTGTYDGSRVVLDPPLDTLPQARVDSVRVRVGPAAREMYGLSYRMVGVLLVWLRPDSAR